MANCLICPQKCTWRIRAEYTESGSASLSRRFQSHGPAGARQETQRSEAGRGNTRRALDEGRRSRGSTERTPSEGGIHDSMPGTREHGPELSSIQTL